MQRFLLHGVTYQLLDVTVSQTLPYYAYSDSALAVDYGRVVSAISLLCCIVLYAIDINGVRITIEPGTATWIHHFSHSGL